MKLSVKMKFLVNTTLKNSRIFHSSSTLQQSGMLHTMYFTSISDNIFNICLWHKSNIATLQCAHIFWLPADSI